MTVNRGLTTIIAATGLALGFASPAWADDFSGTYSLNLSGAPGAHASWTTTSTCPASGGCVAHITSSTGWSADAQLTGDRWTMTVDRLTANTAPTALDTRNYRHGRGTRRR